ncbi:MAG: hypothetical protein Q8M16_10610 [Pirellulaceae bacterium]|nr:hypothetical protein [Pirellulaceae bacterium]
MLSDKAIRIIERGKMKQVFYGQANESFKTVRFSGSKIFTVVHSRGSDFLDERDAKTFKLQNRWQSDSRLVAIVAGRPIFQLGNQLVRGEENGQKTTLCHCESDIGRLLESPSNKQLVGEINDGVLVWDTDSWTAHSHNLRPRQNDRIFAVNDDGHLIILARGQRLKSKPGVAELDTAPLPDSMSPKLGEYSLSANGSGIAYLDGTKQIFHLPLDDDNAPPRLIKLPRDCLPTGVTLGDDGRTLLVRFYPDILRLELDAQQKADSKRLDELWRRMNSEKVSAESGLTETCHVFLNPSDGPVYTGSIGHVPETTYIFNPSINAKSKVISWVGETHTGIRSFADLQTPPTITNIARGEHSGPVALNAKGDAVIRWIHVNRREINVLAHIYWEPSAGGGRKLLAKERYEPGLGHRFDYALNDDGEKLYLSESKGSATVLSTIALPEMKTISKISIPARVIGMRLSPNNRFLGLKLADSRYAVVQLDPH